MKQFGNLGAFAEHLLKAALAEEIAIREGLSKAAKVVEKEAKAEIGDYQGQDGPFVAWADLADATKADRVRQGFPEDEPLLRTGDLRDSIGTAMSPDGLEAQIGSNSDIAVYQELGTATIPPRSFLGGAMARKTDEVLAIVGASTATALVGDQVVNRALPIPFP